jgi:DeoR family fructose operon transcriptional repressor
MHQEKRKKLVLDMLNEKDAITVQDVVRECGVSEITIRRDLLDLESKGLIIRTHGGAVKTRAVDNLFTFDQRINRNRVNKEKICLAASRFISDGDILFIDCGTTLIHLTKYISRCDSVTVITNSLPVVSELINFPQVKLVLIGGEAVSERKAIYGPVAERNITQYHASKAFIGADGITLAKGLSSFDEKESAITLKMIDNADEVYLLCDSSKIGRDSYVTFASLSDINHLVTDDDLDEALLNSYREQGISVITAGERE